jgi:hypothetical protein
MASARRWTTTRWSERESREQREGREGRERIWQASLLHRLGVKNSG